MRKTLTAAALVFALSCHAWAGVIHIPPAPEPPPQSASDAQEPTLNGVMSTPEVSESVTQTVLELIAVLPTLF